jgi:hypothetical protein
MTDHTEKFERIYSKPQELYFDLDKQKYQITNEATNTTALSSVRHICQEYNDRWNAYQHGLREALQKPTLPLVNSPDELKVGRYYWWVLNGGEPVIGRHIAAINDSLDFEIYGPIPEIGGE